MTSAKPGLVCSHKAQNPVCCGGLKLDYSGLLRTGTFLIRSGVIMVNYDQLKRREYNLRLIIRKCMRSCPICLYASKLIILYARIRGGLFLHQCKLCWQAKDKLHFKISHFTVGDL